MANVCAKMKFNRGNNLLIFIFILNCTVYNVASETTKFEEQTESMDTTLPTSVNSEEIASMEVNINSDEENSNEEEDDGFDSSSVETSGPLDMTGMQIGADQIAPIINQLLGPLSTTIQPYLGPLAPLSSVLGNVVSTAVTELVVNLLNQTVASAKRQQFLQIRNNTSYTSYLVKVPNHGRFLLLTKSHRKPRRQHQNHSTDCT